MDGWRGMSLDDAFLIRQVLPLGSPRFGFAPGLVGLGFSQLKMCITVHILYLYIIPFLRLLKSCIIVDT